MQTAPSLELPPRDKILDAATELFARRGFSGVGMREVAEAAGLGKSSLFHHFESKTELYAAVVERILAHLEDRSLRALAMGGDPVARLDRLLGTILDVLAADRCTARLLLRSLFEDDDLAGTSEGEKRVERSTERLFRSLGRLLEEGIAAGAFRPVSIPHTLQSLVGLTVYHFASGEIGDTLLGCSVFAPEAVRRHKEEVRALLLQGLLPSDTPPRRGPRAKGR